LHYFRDFYVIFCHVISPELPCWFVYTSKTYQEMFKKILGSDAWWLGRWFMYLGSCHLLEVEIKVHLILSLFEWSKGWGVTCLQRYICLLLNNTPHQPLEIKVLHVCNAISGQREYWVMITISFRNIYSLIDPDIRNEYEWGVLDGLKH
jgi:hypothetical protein